MSALSRLRRAKHRAALAARSIGSLRPVGSTVLRTPRSHVPPHPSAFAAFGTNSWVVPPARVVNPAAIAIGSNVVVLEHSTLAVVGDGRLTIGDGVHLARFASVVCGASVTIEDDVLSSDGVVIGDTWDLPLAGDRVPALAHPAPRPVHIGRGAYLGFGSCILPGVTVGEGAYVAENAVVVEDVPAHAVAQGNPATVIRRYDPVRETWEGKPWP